MWSSSTSEYRRWLSSLAEFRRCLRQLAPRRYSWRIRVRVKVLGCADAAERWPVAKEGDEYLHNAVAELSLLILLVLKHWNAACAGLWGKPNPMAMTVRSTWTQRATARKDALKLL